MNICIVSPYSVIPPIGGAPSRVLKLAEGLQCNGANVWVLHPGPSESFGKGLNFERFPGLESIYLFKRFMFLNAANNYGHPLNLSVLGKLYKVIKLHKIDLVQSEQPWGAFPSSLLTKEQKIPFILDEHNVELLATKKAGSLNLLWPYTFFIEHFAINNSSAIIAVSNLDKERLISLYDVPSEKVFVVPNGVDLTKYELRQSSEVRKALGIALDETIVFFHGLMSWKPNYEASKLIINYIAPKIAMEFPKVKFLIIGKDASNVLSSLYKQASNVKILDFVPDISDYISIADICIVPLRKGAGTRLKVLEYLAAGKPVVSTFIGAEGFLEDSCCTSPYILACNDVNEEFVNHIKYLLTNKAYAKEISGFARHFANEYDWAKLCKRLLNFYKKIIANES